MANGPTGCGLVVFILIAIVVVFVGTMLAGPVLAMIFGITSDGEHTGFAFICMAIFLIFCAIWGIKNA